MKEVSVKIAHIVPKRQASSNINLNVYACVKNTF